MKIKHERIFKLKNSGSEPASAPAPVVKPPVKPAFIPLPPPAFNIVPTPAPVPAPAPVAAPVPVPAPVALAVPKKKEDLFGENFSNVDDAAGARPTAMAAPMICRCQSHDQVIGCWTYRRCVHSACPTCSRLIR